MTQKIEHQQVTAQLMDGGTVRLEQVDCGESYIVDLDGWQLREICERFGLVAPDHKAAKTIAMLQRRLLVLSDRIDTLASYITDHSDHKHADLSYEMTYATASADIAAEFVAELDGAQWAAEPSKRAAEPPKHKTGADPCQASLEA